MKELEQVLQRCPSDRMGREEDAAVLRAGDAGACGAGREAVPDSRGSLVATLDATIHGNLDATGDSSCRAGSASRPRRTRAARLRAATYVPRGPKQASGRCGYFWICRSA